MASPVYLWYTKEVFYWRSLAATLWSVICLPILVFLMSLILNVSMTNPLVWISDAVADVLSLRFLLTLMAFTLAVVTVTWFSLPYLSVKQEICTSRLSSALGLLRWSRLPFLVICLLNGAVCAWSIANLTGSPFTDFVSTQEYEKTVLNESGLFIVGCGVFTGFCYYCQFFTRQQFYLSFPVILRQKVFQVRSEAMTMAGRIAWQTLHVIKYYYIIYFLFGSLPRMWICASFGISEDSETPPLDSIVGLMSLSLLWKTYLTSFVMTLAFALTLALTRIFHTEHLEFPVTEIMEYSNEKTLSDALVCSYSPLLQHLAFYDLSCMSKFISPRLQELLSLSQPGGHPKTWMAICQTALSAIQELTNQVKEENWLIMSRVPISHHHSHRNGLAAANGNGHFTTNGSAGDRVDSSLVYRGEGNSEEVQVVREEPERPSVMSQWSSRLSSMPVLGHLFTQSQDCSSRRLFSSCQKQIWAVESLSHVAVRAYTEDKYGVVQTSLPIIFMSLLELHESVEKHFKLSASPRRPNGLANSSTDCVNRYKLQSVLKSCLYRMANTYKSHLEDIKLRPEEIKKLMPFIQYTL